MAGKWGFSDEHVALEAAEDRRTPVTSTCPQQLKLQGWVGQPQRGCEDRHRGGAGPGGKCFGGELEESQNG